MTIHLQEVDQGATTVKGADRPWLVLVLASLIVGCSGLFDVENATNILDEDLDDPLMIEALGYTPEGAVAMAYSNAVSYGEMVGDAVLHHASQTFGQEIDFGYMNRYNFGFEGVYNNLASARWVAEDATKRLETLVDSPNSHPGVANGYFWASIARITLADLFEEVPFDGNPPITPAEALETAITGLRTAAEIAENAGDANLQAAAYGAIARAYRSLYFEVLHFQGREEPSLFEQAATYASEALAKNADFRIDVHYAQPGSANGVYNLLNVGLYNAMDPRYAFLKDPVTGEVDPRIKHTGLISVGTRGDSIYRQLKYPDFNAPIPVSRAAEALLILAEYSLMTGLINDAVGYINDVRVNAGLQPFSSTDPDEVRTQLLYERRVELWLELRRWQDMRYYQIVPERWRDVNKTAGLNRRWRVSDQERGANDYYN